MEVLTRIWDRVSATAPPPSSSTLIATATVAALLVLSPTLWRTSRHVVTIAHEGAHGVAALLTGRRLSGIRLHSDTSGLTVSAGRPTGPGMVLTCAAGYTGPVEVEVFNADVWARPGDEILAACVESYARHVAPPHP